MVSYISSLEWKKPPLFVDFSADERVFEVYTGNPEFFTTLPETPAALNDDVARQVAPRWFSSEELKSLNVDEMDEYVFISELYMMQEITHALLANKSAITIYSPDFFHFHIDGLEQLVKRYGSESRQFKDALSLLTTVTQRVIGVLREIYGDRFVAELVTLPPGTEKTVSRRGRSLLQAVEPPAVIPPTTPATPSGKATQYSPEYPAIFHIFFWSSLGLGLCLWFTSYAIWFMDPNRDSIIYRMTSQRMKRD